MKGQIRRREWRKLVKKLQRKRRRQKKAKELENKEQKETLAKLCDPDYQNWQQHQIELERLQKQHEMLKHDEEEEAWQRRELIAQRTFRLEQKRLEAERAAEEALRIEEHKKLEERQAAQKKQREERARLQAEAAAEFDRIMEKMEFYSSSEGSQTPTELQRIIETYPGEKLCEFYDRTNCCRFGLACTFNHKRPILARILLIHNFFVHPLLEENSTDDSHLESSERDLREDYDDFFEDACSELETFGKIINFRTVRNIQPHLRGNVFVEYETKRSALKAFTALQGRFYAKRRLIVEFSNIKRWRGAVCGLSISRNCTRGLKCSYLHLFRNPGNKYNTTLESIKTPLANSTPNACTPKSLTPLLSWDDVSPYISKRNWRWSESPEPVISLEKEIISRKLSSTEENLGSSGRNRSKDVGRLRSRRSPLRRQHRSKHSSSDRIKRKRELSMDAIETRRDYSSRR